MIANLLKLLSGFVIWTISTSGYAGILVLMAIESACIPLPSEVIMPFSGYLVFTGRFRLLWVATVGAVGCNLGSAVAYWVGAHGGRPLVEKYGSWIFLSRRELDWADHFFQRYGDITVFLSRMLPVVRTFIAFPAGLARMPMLKFQLYTFVGSWPWCFALAYIGAKLGERWETDPTLREIFHRFDVLIVAVFALAVIWYVWRHWRHRLSSEE